MSYLRQDRFLLGIIIGAIILAAAALILFFARGRSQTYGPETDPPGVARNYLLAVQKEDYRKAYGYLQEAPLKPDYETFRSYLVNTQGQSENFTLQVIDSKIDGREAVLSLALVSGSPFGEPNRSTDKAILKQDASGVWKVKQMPYSFWGYDWYGEASKTIPAEPAPTPEPTATPKP
jgi:hypothetical protein